MGVLGQAFALVFDGYVLWVILGSAVFGGVVFYIVAADKLGFYLTGMVIIALWVRALGASWRMTLLMAVIAPLIIHLAFYKGLRVPLPWGVLERWAF